MIIATPKMRESINNIADITNDMMRESLTLMGPIRENVQDAIGHIRQALMELNNIYRETKMVQIEAGSITLRQMIDLCDTSKRCSECPLHIVDEVTGEIHLLCGKVENNKYLKTIISVSEEVLKR